MSKLCALCIFLFVFKYVLINVANPLQIGAVVKNSYFWGYNLKLCILITIYHNARCSKSREGLSLLESSGEEFKVREYLKNPLSEKELKDIVGALGVAPIELVRTNEKLWKESYKGKDISDDELVRVMVNNPTLIQRPIVVKGKRAVIGRPVENISSLL